MLIFSYNSLGTGVAIVTHRYILLELTAAFYYEIDFGFAMDFRHTRSYDPINHQEWFLKSMH